MTVLAVPDPVELIPLIQDALCEAVRQPDVRKRDSGRVITPAVKRPLWKMGFKYAGVYPRASGLGDGAQSKAQAGLNERAVGEWIWDPRKRDHSALREYSFDVSWIEYDDEYRGKGARDFEIPAYKRLILAFETELGGRAAVLYDFDKLLAARAKLRVLFWDSRDKKSKYRDGHEELAKRLRDADGGREGWWLLSGWGDEDCLEHRVYHKGERQQHLEQHCNTQ